MTASAARASQAVDNADANRAVEAYRERLGPTSSAVDELVGADGAAHPASGDLSATIDLLGVPGLLARRAEATRLVEDDGVTYGAAGRWQLDPLPVVIDAQEWRGLEPALVQRADLLDRLLTDFYGPRDLLRRRLVPAEVVLGHAGFLRQADQVRLPGPRQLILAAADLGRGSDGKWSVYGDRTAAPSGAGYAMENRRIISRVMPGLYRDTRLERLRDFFHAVRAGLQEVSPATAEDPRVVVLTPGPGSETAFDQSFLSTLLGYPLVGGEDLTVREGRVYMRTLRRLEPVDVVLRRVDAWFADPLELRPDSRLGVPGLLEASRLGTVSVVNTMGSGVLENPGLLPFLPQLCQTLLDAPLLLPSALTFWCGDAVSRQHVLSNVQRLVIKPIARGVGRASRFGWELSQAELDGVRRRIESEPHAWCGQEPLALGTTPVVTSRGLEPRRMVLRTFAVAQGGRYRVLAGGLARAGDRTGSHLVSNLSGALAKDVWVLDDRSVTTEPGRLAAGSDTLAATHPLPAAMSPRAAESLFWLGRYAERAEGSVRLLRVIDDLADDWGGRPGTAGARSLAILLATLTEVTPERLAAPHRELLDVAVDATRPGSLAYAVRRTIEAGHAVREQLSLDTWIVLGSLDRVLAELAAQVQGPDAVGDPPLQPPLARVLEGLLALAGLAAESLVRDAGWHLMDAGRRIERSLSLLAVLRYTLMTQGSPAVEALVLESVLIVGESIVTHRRRNHGRAQVRTVLDLLLLDRENPRALAYQLDRLAEDLRRLPGDAMATTRQVRELVARLREVDAATWARAERSGRRAVLVAGLDRLIAEVEELSDAVQQAHFPPAAPPRPIAATPGWDA